MSEIWGAALITTAGSIGGALISKSGQDTLPANNYNAYGEVNSPVTGAINSRDSIFNALNDPNFQAQVSGAQGNYLGALNSAANSPLLNSAKGYTSDVLSGNYLNSPIVKGYADQAYKGIISQGANQDARIQAGYANNGLGFSTGMQQAQQANKAATASSAAGTRAGILSSNYQQERQLQQGAVGNAETLNSATPSYLSQINSALYAPYQAQGGITTNLLGSPVQSPQPTYVQQPSGLDAAASGLSFGTGLASLYGKLQKSSGGGSSGNTSGYSPTDFQGG